MTDGRIAGFTTAMTGELFALLRGHSLLAGALAAEVTDGDAFREGLAEGARRDLAASLFGIRAAGISTKSMCWSTAHACPAASSISRWCSSTTPRNRSHVAPARDRKSTRL